ncbi:putative pentatricopeptide repeat-containing protein [Nymphaea thermarum]|nr:putative pentatricopeptide repeat-containing protein [Nymphaea thermarum]
MLPLAFITFNSCMRSSGFAHSSVPCFLRKLHMTSNVSMLEKASTVKCLREIHARMIRNSEVEDILTVSRLVAQCTLSEFGNMGYARLVFDQIKRPNIFIWNTMIRGYAQSDCPHEGLALYDQLLQRGYVPNNYTFPFVLKACAMTMDFSFGSKIHGVVLKLGMHGSDAFVQTSLLSFYAACGCVEDASQVFDESLERDVTCWNAMINGYVKAGQCRDAVQVFRRMQLAGQVRPDQITMLGVLAACAQLGALDMGRWLHMYIDKNQIRCNASLGTALVDMYAKCGRIDVAVSMFNEMPVKDVFSWSVIIGGLAMHGLANKALNMFSEMLRTGVNPDSVTFTGVLCACSHGGLVEEGLKHLSSMSSMYNITPTIEHYGCVVDLYSRSGRLEEALHFIETITMKPDVVLWGSLFVACKARGNTEIGKLVARRILELDPCHGGAYVFLSNIYASSSEWDGVQQVRTLMKDQGIRKFPGCSFIEVDGVVHEFVSGDTSHPQMENIKMMMDEIARLLRLEGYTQTTKGVLFDIEEEEKENALAQHSEKLAIAFGLLSTRPGSTLLIVKNIRVCADCHSAMQLISKIFHRLIIVRDRNRSP